jgi:hypothetical protein
MQVKNQWENAKLIMLNNKASIDNGFCYSISNKTKVILISCVGDCYCYRHGIFQNISINIQYKYLSQTMTTADRGPHTKYAYMPKGPLFLRFATDPCQYEAVHIRKSKIQGLLRTFKQDRVSANSSTKY